MISLCILNLYCRTNVKIHVSVCDMLGAGLNDLQEALLQECPCTQGAAGRWLRWQCGEQHPATKDASRAVEPRENPRSLLGTIPVMEGVPGHGTGSATSSPAAAGAAPGA